MKVLLSFIAYGFSAFASIYFFLLSQREAEWIKTSFIREFIIDPPFGIWLAVFFTAIGVLSFVFLHNLPAAPLPDDLKKTHDKTPNSTAKEDQKTRIPPQSATPSDKAIPVQRTYVPLIDIELERVKGSPEFAQYQIQFSYDIFLHNKSDVTIYNISVHREINPDKNKQRIALHQAQGKLKPFQKRYNVLRPDERWQVYREYSSSYEFMFVIVYYKDQYDKAFKCTFEGDRDGVYLKNKEVLGQKEGK